MENTGIPLLKPATRTGFHYYPDTLHYRESDLIRWLPVLKGMGASWLVIQSDTRRAIPETFFNGLLREGIEPIVQFGLSPASPPNLADLTTLLEAYAHWGAQAVLLFDRPNASASWSNGHWAQQNLVERFLDRFLPLSGVALKLGLLPLFPTLEPGGSYWDTAFLRAALVSLERRKQTALLQRLALSGWAHTGSRSLNWGSGGPERWPESRPYATPAGSEDQRGFRIFDWYQAVARQVLGQALPIILFGAGSPGSHLYAGEHRETALNIARLMAGETVADPTDMSASLDPVPAEVLACNFWRLAGDQDAWFPEDDQPLPAATAIQEWRAARAASGRKMTIPNTGEIGARPIAHYLLLPTYDWGVSEWHLSIIRPFVQKHAPTIGFSLAEAALARHVTVVGNEQSFAEEDLDQLRAAGCSVRRISGDGTSIATQLAER